jgi:hypothetical protein
MRTRTVVLITILAMLLPVATASAVDRPHRRDQRRPGIQLHAIVQARGVAHLEPRVPATGPRRPAVKDNFEVLSHVRMPGKQAAADVYFFDHGARGKFAYVGSFRDPCSTDGVRIFDVSRPRHASVAGIASLPRSWNTSVEDVVVERVGGRTVLAGGLQACADAGRDGMALWDVSRPRHPERLTFMRTPAGVHELEHVLRHPRRG